MYVLLSIIISVEKGLILPLMKFMSSLYVSSYSTYYDTIQHFMASIFSAAKEIPTMNIKYMEQTQKGVCIKCTHFECPYPQVAEIYQICWFE